MPEEILMKAIEVVDNISEQIREKEADCLRRIFIRFTCIKKGVEPNIKNVTIKYYQDRPNLWEYVYDAGKPTEYLLMTRELIIEDNQPKLNIIFNCELAVNNEL